MMKTLGLVLALLVICCGGLQAAPATVDVYDGWNYIAAPLVPFEPEPYFAWDEVSAAMDLGRLNRYDATTGQTLTYLVDEAFGKLLLGDGYQLLNDGGAVIAYDGVPDGVPDGGGVMTDMWISLPGIQSDGNNGGWHLIGTPYAHNIPAYNAEPFAWRVFFTNGSELKDWFAASEALWVADTMYGYSNGLSDDVSFATENIEMKAGRGYWLETKVDNIAMILIAE